MVFPKTKMNNWILSKIKQFLESKEGCNVEDVAYTMDGAKTVVQDSFGYRYEIQVKTLGRIQDDGNNEGFQGLKRVTSFLQSPGGSL